MKQLDGGDALARFADTRSASLRPAPRRTDAPVLGLTVLCHPQVARVGEEARLSELTSGRPQPLSRLEPRFMAPHVAERQAGLRALESVHLSRHPILVRMGEAPGSVVVERAGSRTRVTIDHHPLEQQHTATAEQVARGVLIVLSRRVVLLLHRLPPRRDVPRAGLIGASEAIERLRDEIERVANLDVPILLRGETGTGKELVARAIHRRGRRRDRPFVALNVGAVPETLAAAELFGAARGAYTGADRKKVGYYERAERGTLFLDEIGDIPDSLQVLLLRALDLREIQPVGGTQPYAVDVRVIAATDADLEGRVEARSFRAPLLHRLAGYTLHVPSLRARPDDVARLFFHFLHRELAALGDTAPPEGEDGAPWPPASLMVRLVRYEWPGNVRQLRNVVRRLAISGRHHPPEELEQLIEDLLDVPPSSAVLERTARQAAGAGDDAESPAREPDRNYRQPHEITDEELIEALRANRWRMKPTAHALGVSRASLYGMVDRAPGIRRATDLRADELRAAIAAHGLDLDAMADALCVSRYGLQRRLRELGLGAESDPDSTGTQP